MPTKETLEGTSVSRAHLGDTASRRLAAMVKDNALAPAMPVAVVGTEAANAIPVSLQLVDADGSNLPSSRRLLCQALDANMEFGAVAAFTLAETGTGDEVSTTAKAGLLITTDKLGVAQVTVTDVSGILAATAWLLVTPVDGFGAPALIPMTFA